MTILVKFKMHLYLINDSRGGKVEKNIHIGQIPKKMHLWLIKYSLISIETKHSVDTILTCSLLWDLFFNDRDGAASRSQIL